MERLAEFMEAVRRLGDRPGQFRGLLHVLIGRHIALTDGTEISSGLTWRQAAGLLRDVRWNKDAVIELGLQSRDLPPRDRERYWYTAIQHAGLDQDAARQAGAALALKLAKLGYQVGSGPKLR